jgi:S-DNA-T family DNA segregation ATPase FtsK/SpoIIIE
LLRADLGYDGGRVGWSLAEIMRMLLAPIGLGAPLWSVLLLLPIFLLSLLIGLGLRRPLMAWASLKAAHPVEAEFGENGFGPAVMVAPLPGSTAVASREVKDSRETAQKKKAWLPEQFRKNFRIQPEGETAPSTPRERDERLPPLEILGMETAYRQDERDINQTAGMIEKTLAEFGIPATVVGFRVGPTVTQFAVAPGFVEKEKPSSEGDPRLQKVRVAQIAALGRDLALALSAERLRIEAPVPGRPYVGIEVPNARSSTVRLRPILESDAFYKLGSPLAIALGRDVSGQPVVADLGKMPHLLVAGTTGSVKSVCIAAITACLVMNNTPEDLRLVMIDPKMVELVRFNGLPHLYWKVETKLERILAVLQWTVAEMDRRYKLLEVSHSRNIDTYNKKARRRAGSELLPRIVVLVDELADLMMSAPEQTEHTLVRLAQMARATGIHLVVATQRPSTDVVTGLIKANFPARVSFAVASTVDSRVILDTGGAEALLGRGDMLFVPPEAPAPIRSQGVLISDQEIERIINFWQKSLPAGTEPEQAPWEKMLEDEQVLADRDDLVAKATQVVRETGRASASLLQRRLHIGYPRAARLMDELEELGVVGPAQGGGREREVLPTDEDEAEDL